MSAQLARRGFLRALIAAPLAVPAVTGAAAPLSVDFKVLGLRAFRDWEGDMLALTREHGVVASLGLQRFENAVHDLEADVSGLSEQGGPAVVASIGGSGVAQYIGRLFGVSVSPALEGLGIGPADLDHQQFKQAEGGEALSMGRNQALGELFFSHSISSGVVVCAATVGRVPEGVQAPSGMRPSTGVGGCLP